MVWSAPQWSRGLYTLWHVMIYQKLATIVPRIFRKNTISPQFINRFPSNFFVAKSIGHAVQNLIFGGRTNSRTGFSRQTYWNYHNNCWRFQKNRISPQFIHRFLSKFFVVKTIAHPVQDLVFGGRCMSTAWFSRQTDTFLLLSISKFSILSYNFTIYQSILLKIFCGENDSPCAVESRFWWSIHLYDPI